MNNEYYYKLFSKQSVDMLKEMSLSENEVMDLIEKKIISFLFPIMYSEKQSDGYYHTSYNVNTEQALLTHEDLEKKGAQFVFSKKDDSNIDHLILITDFHLIYLNNYNDSAFQLEDGSTAYKKPHTFYVIPLEKILSIELIKNDYEFTDCYGGKTRVVQKNAAAGAVVGAVLAGTTGAVIGAAVNSGTKTVKDPIHYTHWIYYDLQLQFLDCNRPFILEKIVEHNLAKEDEEKVLKQIDYDNNQFKKILKNAKEIKSESERINVVDSTKQVNTKFNNSVNFIANFIIISIILLIVFVIAHL